jgi:RNA polymerase sigma-70 factor (ECF subfamily)
MKKRDDDRQLIARLRSHDESAVGELARRYRGRIYQLALRQMRNSEDAEEVTQDVLMKVYRKADAFRGDSALSSWIYRITFNTAMSRLRSGKLARRAEQPVERIDSFSGDEPKLTHEPMDYSPLPDETLLASQLRSAVAEALTELPEIYRVPVVLRDIQGLSTEEASRRLNVKDQTLKSRLHRGRVMLRRRLDAFSGGLSLHGHSIAAAA